MSVQTLYTAATGMQALEAKMDVIANNLANVNTVGFKRDRANFEDLFYRNETLPGALDESGNPTPTGTQIGLGVRVAGVQTSHVQGAFQQTDNPLDVTITGRGFFQVQQPGGETVYTRAGNFSVNANGQLVLSSSSVGRLLNPPISVPPDHLGVVIQPDGNVMFRPQGATDLQSAGQIQLAVFPNPDGLLKLGDNLFAQTGASANPVQGNPGQQGIGTLRSGVLEASNVEPVKELIDLITTQRSFELNSQAIQAGDDMLQQINNLRRF